MSSTEVPLKCAETTQRHSSNFINKHLFQQSNTEKNCFANFNFASWNEIYICLNKLNAPQSHCTRLQVSMNTFMHMDILNRSE